MSAVTWATLLATDEYARGVLCLARSLREVASAYHLEVIVTPAVSAKVRSMIEREPGCRLRTCQRLDVPAADSATYLNSRFAECWTKVKLALRIARTPHAMVNWLGARQARGSASSHAMPRDS